MVSFNWIDVIIICIFAAAIYKGIRVGFLTLLLTFSGFFGSLFLLGWLLPHILPIHGSTALVVISGNLIFIVSIYIAFHAYDYGVRLHRSFGEGKAHIIESIAGLSLSLGSAIILVWLVSAAMVALPFVGLSNTVDNSLIVQSLSSHLPPAPAVFEDFSTLVNPNTTPVVFVNNVPNADNGIALAPAITAPVKEAGQSVVRITGFGCNGIVSGSGFVVSKDVIATDAHVIAGLSRPIVKYQSRSYAATPILFDSNLDFALIRINNFRVNPLNLDGNLVNKGTPIDTVGYPSSIFTIKGGMLRDSLMISGPNIYGLGTILRNIYVIQTQVSEGLSGGPIVLSDGSVAGIIFAKPANNGNYGYALTAASLTSDLSHALNSQQQVGTGTCIAS